MRKPNGIRLDKIVYYDRGQAQELGKLIRRNKSGKVVIDFSNVVFISRAFAEEWLNVLDKVSLEKTVVVRNLKTDPRKMIQLVRKKRREIHTQVPYKPSH